MTCVIALKANENKIVLGGDSFCGDEVVSYLCKAPKVYKVGPVGIGICGQVRSEQILEQTAKTEIPKAIENETLTKEWLMNDFIRVFHTKMQEAGAISEVEGSKQIKDSEYIITYNGEIFLLDEEFGLWEVGGPFAAIGAGKPFALGALQYAFGSRKYIEEGEKVALRTLRSVEKYSPWVSAPHKIIEV